jgi:SAM-dependent methyltransferase
MRASAVHRAVCESARVQRAPSYLESRFRPDERRELLWKLIADHLSRWWQPDSDVLDVGAGYCSFINAVSARRRVAVDVHGRLSEFAQTGVECVECSATQLQLETSSFDVVFSSNLLEHLDRAEIRRALAEFHRVLRKRGRLILIQPNYRLCSSAYFDDYTHVTPLSDRSLADLLTVSGFHPIVVRARFMPLTLRSRASKLSFLVPLYLRSPWRPFAGQMLLIAERSAELSPSTAVELERARAS